MDFGKGMALKTQIDSKDVSLKAWVGRGRRLKDKKEGCGRKRGEMVRGYQDHLSEISTHSYSAHQARPALPEGLITGLVTSGGSPCVVDSKEGLQISTQLGGRYCQATV